MPIFLYAVGAVVVAIGAAMIGFGIPNNEFGIGNTLIGAGTTAFVGGLIVIALGIAVAQLQRLTEALATRPAVRSSRPFETFDPAVAAVARPAATAPARVPFPPKTKAEARPPEPRIDAQRPPFLPNPDEPPVTVADEAQLSPESEASRPDRADAPGPDRDEHVPSTPLPPLLPRKPKTYFDAMWPAEPKSAEAAKPAEPKLFEPKPFEAKPLEANSVETASDDFAPAEQKPVEPKASEFQWSDIRRGEPKVAEPEAEQQPEEEEAPRAVAILKSGVVDGMGYTLYVDGSIEAELPQGTLRFASINELRSHLEKTS